MSQDEERRAVRIDATHYAVLGIPNTYAQLDNFERIQTHDELGLPLDPAVYAKSSCRTCNGTGFLHTRRAVTFDEAVARARKLLDASLQAHAGEEGTAPVADETEVCRLARVVAKDSTVESDKPCGCTVLRYRRAREVVQRALAQELVPVKGDVD